jgi:hydrogenase maturation factor
VIAGFEPLDVMQSALMLVRQLNEGRCEVENQYTRAVTEDRQPQGPGPDRRGLSDPPELRMARARFPARQRIGLADTYADLDAEQRFPVQVAPAKEVKGCECPAILRGVKTRPTASSSAPLHPREPHGLLHGVLRGRLCRLLELRAVQGATAAGLRQQPAMIPEAFQRGRNDSTGG